MIRRWHVVASWIRDHGWTRGAELGVLRGDMYLWLLSRMPQLELVGVDIWEPCPAQDAMRDDGGRSYAEHDLTFYEKHVRTASKKYGDRARLIKGWTQEVAKEFPDSYFDFVFLDGDHTFEGVRDDILAWRSKVREGGALCGHDYENPPFPGVARAVNELCGTVSVYPDHVWRHDVA